jgi:hypothetical protein
VLKSDQQAAIPPDAPQGNESMTQDEITALYTGKPLPTSIAVEHDAEEEPAMVARRGIVWQGSGGWRCCVVVLNETEAQGVSATWGPYKTETVARAMVAA